MELSSGNDSTPVSCLVLFSVGQVYPLVIFVLRMENDITQTTLTAVSYLRYASDRHSGTIIKVDQEQSTAFFSYQKVSVR